MINCFKHDLGDTWKSSVHKDPPSSSVQKSQTSKDAKMAHFFDIYRQITNSLDKKAPHPNS